MKEFFVWTFFGVFIALMILVDLLNQKRNPPFVTKEKKDGETEYTVYVSRISKGGPYFSDFVFARSAWEGRYLPKFRGELKLGVILIGGVSVCAVVFPLFAGSGLSIEYLGMVAIIFLIELTAFALVELRAVLRAYRALKKYLKYEMK